MFKKCKDGFEVNCDWSSITPEFIEELKKIKSFCDIQEEELSAVEKFTYLYERNKKVERLINNLNKIKNE